MNRLLQTLALSVLATTLLFGAASSVQACEDNLIVTAASSSGPQVFASVANGSSTTRKGYLILSVIMRGRAETVSIPISVPAQGSTEASVTFAVDVEFNGGEACEYDPGGNTESPDPIIEIKTSEDEADDPASEE